MIAELEVDYVVYVRRGVPPDCPVLPKLRAHRAGLCDRCGANLTGRQTRWCSRKCALWAYKEFGRHHEWSDARKAAKRRDKHRCVKCGSHDRLEVNHIVPRRGAGYKVGCHHHLSNLETLCHRCHVEVTNAQRAEHRKTA